MVNYLCILNKESQSSCNAVSKFLQGFHGLSILFIVIPHRTSNFGKPRSFLITSKGFCLPYTYSTLTRITIIMSINLATEMKSHFMKKENALLTC